MGRVRIHPFNSSAVVEVDEKRVDVYLTAGWVRAAGEQEGHKPFSQLNKAELEQVAADEGVDLPEGATKAEIREAIEAHRSAN